MRYTFYHPKNVLNTLTGGMIGGEQKAPKVTSPDTAKAQEGLAADEAARRLRAREKMRAGVSSTLTSGVTGSQFGAIQAAKPTLLGSGGFGS